MAKIQALNEARLALSKALKHVEESLAWNVHHPESGDHGELEFSARLTDLLDDLDKLIAAKTGSGLPL